MQRTKLLLILMVMFNYSLEAQWQGEALYGGFSGEIVNIGSTLLVEAGNGGVYKSNNDGATWKLKVAGLPVNEGVRDLVVENDLLYASLSRDGVYVSSDKGESWNPINAGIEEITFLNIAVSGSEIYGGNANGGIYYSSDNGGSWVEKSNGISNIQFQGLAFFKSNIYIGGRSFYRSTNNGDTWREIEVAGLDVNGVRSMVATERTLFIADALSVYTSTNGRDWEKSVLPIRPASITNLGVSGDKVFATTSSGSVYYTTDAGQSWESIENTSTEEFARDAIFLDDRIIMSTSEGIFTSTNDGKSWFESNDGLRSLQITAVATDGDNTYAGSNGVGIFRSDQSGNWSKINEGLDASNSRSVHDIVLIDDDIVIATGGGVYRSSDNGDTWERVLNPGVNNSVGAMGSSKDVMAAAVNGVGVYLSFDNGNSWSLGSTNGLTTSVGYSSLTIRGNRVVVATNNREIFVSNGSISRWSDISVSGKPYFIYDVTFDGDKLYAGTNDGVIISEDLGDSWSLINDEVRDVQDMAFVDGKIVAASNEGVFVTAESREIWYDVSSNLGNQAVNVLTPSRNTVIAGTFATGVWVRKSRELNLPPIILDVVEPLSTLEESPIRIKTADLVIDDDNLEDIDIIPMPGDNYTVRNNRIIPEQDFNGVLTVPVVANDGMDESAEFEIALEVLPVNDPPQIEAFTGLSIIPGNSAFEILLEDLQVTDVDNEYPGDFTLTVLEGENYVVNGNQITPEADFVGTIDVLATVNDGEDDSDAFPITLEVAEVLGTQHMGLEAEFLVYPNPVSEVLSVESKRQDTYEINIFTLAGEKVFSRGPLQKEMQQFDLSNLQNGVYFLLIKSSEGLAMTKLIKR